MIRRARQSNESGSELIELAIVLPILVLIVMGIVDFGFLFQRYEVVTNAAREGARLSVLGGSTGYELADVQSRVQSYLASGGLTGPSTIEMTNTSETIAGVTMTTRTVTVTYPTQLLYIGPTINLRAVSVMRME